MGRHYRDEEPVPHPQDRTPRVPAEGRSEASGAFRTPGRSSISDAFGIAGRGSAARSSGSAFFTEGAEAPGFPPPENGGTQPAATRRGEASGSYPVAERSPGARRGEASGSYPVARTGESTVTRAPRRGAASGAHPVTSSEITTTLSTRVGEASGAHPVADTARRGEASGAYPVTETTRAARRGEASGTHPVADTAARSGAYPAATTATRRGDASGTHPADTTARRGEASGAYPVADTATTAIRLGEATGADAPTRSRRKGGDHPAPDRVEAPASGRSTRASRRAGAAETSHPAAGPAATGGRRSRRKAADPRPESAAERTEIITRQDDDLTPDRSEDTASRSERSDTTGPQRAGRGDSTGPSRAGRSEGTGSHRVVGKSDATGSHRIVGKKAPRRRIATWPIACLVLAVLIGLGVVGWNWADNELNSRAEAQAASCDGGTAHMRVLVTPSVQKPVTAAAERWNQAATVVHGQCVHVMIEAKPSAQVLDALVGRAKMDSIGGLPAAWLPESTYWVSELTTKKPEMIGSPAQSVANARSADYPFIGLAGPGIDDTALRAAQTFREYLEQPAQQADFAAAGIKSA